jgi:hypothetical protein
MIIKIYEISLDILFYQNIEHVYNNRQHDDIIIIKQKMNIKKIREYIKKKFKTIPNIWIVYNNENFTTQFIDCLLKYSIGVKSIDMKNMTYIKCQI